MASQWKVRRFAEQFGDLGWASGGPLATVVQGAGPS
jgi:hypothetical protein